MKKSIYIFILIIFSSIASSEPIEESGVEVSIKLPDGSTKLVDIYRDIPDECKIDMAMKTKLIWGGNYANKIVSKDCKASFVTTVGKISPMKLHKDIETYGELEVLEFLKNMSSVKEQKSKDMIFVDSRAVKWYNHRTIPSAVNIPFIYFRDSKRYQKEFEASLRLLGVVKVGNRYNFSKAKEVLMFCNGAWCGQSPTMIRVLLKIGYPPKKIKWYRGGMQSWLGLSMSSTKSKVD
jgi:rhodanese-related sulfurtransferase